MGDRVRVGLIGCGFYARNHLHAWRDLDVAGADLVGVCDIDEAKAKAAGEAFGAPWFTDPAAMLDTARPDLVDIATRMDSHRALAQLAAERGVAAVVQKPFAPSYEDCVAAVETARRHGAFLAVHENFRFQTPMRRVASVLASDAIGDANWGRISFRTGFDVYRTQPYFYGEERLAILDVGIHVLDLARVFFGEVERVSCETQRRNSRVRAEDTATMLLRHVSGAVSVVECTYESRRIPDPFPETLREIEGTARFHRRRPRRAHDRDEPGPVLGRKHRRSAAFLDVAALARLAGGRLARERAHAGEREGRAAGCDVGRGQPENLCPGGRRL